MQKHLLNFYEILPFEYLGKGKKGPVSGFVGRIPHPSLESRNNRNPWMGANLSFLFGFGLT